MSPTGDLLLSHLFLLGKCLHELAQKPSRVALASHQASGSTPYWGNYVRTRMEEAVAVDFLNLAFSNRND